MVDVLIRMKWRVLRNSLRGNQAWVTGAGAVVGLFAAFGTIALSAVDHDRAGVGVDVLAAIFLVWTVGWLFAPVFTGGGDETLRPEHFALLPIGRWRLAGGLLGAAFVGVPAIVTFAAFGGLLAFADGAAAAAVAVVAWPLQLVFVVLLSRVMMASLGAVLRSRRGRDLGVILAALVGLSGFALQAAFQSVGPVLVEGGSPALSTVLRALPSGWGTVAVDAAARGEWPLVLGAVAGLFVLVAGLLAVWGVLLERRTTRVAVNIGPRERRTRSGLGHWLPPTRIGAVAGKELRTWARDARRRVALLSMLFLGVFVSVLPAVTGDDPDSLQFTASVVVTLSCLLAGNLYGMDGSALWHTLVVPGAEAADVRGRQLAWLLIVAPVTLVLAVVLPALTDPSTYPGALGLVPALLGAGSGLVVVMSVYTGYPMPPQQANPFAAGGNPGLARVGKQLGIALLMGVVALPVILIVALGSGTPVEWLALPVGLGLGVLGWWWWGRLAARRLTARGPELLAEVGKAV